MADSRLAFDITARGGSAAAAEFEKVAAASDHAGDAMKKNSKISAEAAKASAALTKARSAETNALDKVQVAEARLADVRSNSNAKTGQVVAAEKALARARREAAAAGNVAQKAAKDLGQVLDDEGKKAGKGLLGALKRTFDLGSGDVFKQIGDNAGNGILGGITGALKTPVIGPALVAGIGGALLAVLPEVGSIAGAGIVAGFGAGLAGLGIVFAAKTVAVKNAWNRTLWSMAADMKVISVPFQSTLVQMAGVAKQTFATFKPELAGAFKTLAPAVAAFGAQLGDAFALLAPAIQPLSAAFAAVLKSLGPAMQSALGNVSQGLQDLSASVEKNPTGLADLTTGLGQVLQKSLDTITVLNDLNGALKKIPGGFSGFTGLADKLSPVKGDIDAISAAIVNLDKLLAGSTVDSGQLAGVLGKSGAAAAAYGHSAAAAAGSADKQAGATARSTHELHAANVAAALLAGTYNRQVAATNAVIASLNRMSGVLLGLQGAQISYAQSVADATAAIKANGHTHDLATQKGRDNSTALLANAQAAIVQRDAMLSANDGFLSSAKFAETSRVAYAKLAHQMGYTIPVAKAMAAAAIAIPPIKRVTLTANITDLQTKLATAETALKSPHLTATKKAKLEAEIKNLQAGIATAKALLATLPMSRTAKLQANIADLQAKIATAKTQLADPHLTATKKAKLQAEIAQLQAAVATAQATINSLHGKTVTNSVVTQYSSTGVNLTNPSSVGRKAAGGPVTKGQPYIVGEKRPELFVPNESGTIIPRVPSMAVGSSIASGMAAGLRGGAGDAVSAAAEVALAVIGKAKDVLGIASPSKAFAQLGLYVNQGFKTGLLGSSKSVQSAMSSLMGKVLNISFNAADTKKSIQKTITSLNASLAAARGRIKPVTGNSKQKATIERGNRQAEASIRSIQAKLKSAYTDLANVNAIANRLGTTVKRNAVIGMLGRENAAMQKLANARAVVASQLAAAQTKLADAIQVRDDFKKQITDAALSFNSIINISSDPGITLAASDILQHMQQTLAQTRKFASELASLKKAGLRDDLYKQIADAGVDGGGSTAAALLSGGSGAIKAANSLQAQIASASAGLGNTASQNLYQAGVDAAQGLVNGLLAKTKALDAASKKLADAIVAQIKKTLGIRSPSKVLEWHGSMVGHGFARGISGEVGRVRRASAGLGNAAVPAVSGRRRSGTPGGAQGGVIRLEIAAGDSSPYTEFLVRELRKYVRVAGGGSVQMALGVGK